MDENRFEPANEGGDAWDAIAGYLSGTLAHEERDAFEARLRLDPALQHLVARTEESLVLLGDQQEGHVTFQDHARRRLLERVQVAPRSGRRQSSLWQTSLRQTSMRQTSMRRWAWGVAGAMGAALVVVVGAKTMMPNRYVAESVIETDVGEYATVMLTDGAQVRLAPDSRLRYTASAHETAVTLSGKAFFTVHPQANHSFSVSAGNTRTRVLGTSFQVSHYAGDSVTHVAVTDGKVTVEAEPVTNRGPVVLSAGMMAWADDSIAVAASGARDAVQWVDGRLTFTRAPVPVILETLGRWYGYQFRLADSVLATRHATMAFEIGKPSDVMHTLRTVLDVRPDIDGNIVTLHAETAPTAPTRRPPAKRIPDTLIHSMREVGK